MSCNLKPNDDVTLLNKVTTAKTIWLVGELRNK